MSLGTAPGQQRVPACEHASWPGRQEERAWLWTSRQLPLEWGQAEHEGSVHRSTPSGVI